MRVIVEGNIGSGKSTALRGVATALPHASVHVESVSEWGETLQLFYANPTQWALPFSLKVLLTHHANKTPPAPDHIQVLERCPLSCRHVFTQLLFNDGTMPQHHWDLYRQFSDELGFEPTSDDLILYIDTPVDVCLQRIATRSRRGEDHVDIQYLKKLEFQYGNMLKYCACPVEYIDGTLPPKELVAAILEAISNRGKTSYTV
jgi:deoxyadenosine/deoxycytidine kinase